MLARRVPAGAETATDDNNRDSAVLKPPGLQWPAMDMVSLASAMIGAQSGEMQLAVAARLSRIGNPDGSSSIAQLVGAADQSVNSLANVAANIGTNLDITA